MSGIRDYFTNGCPFGSTPGPCMEWQLTISTSGGKCLSSATISGALHDVWPPTIAPSLVAMRSKQHQLRNKSLEQLQKWVITVLTGSVKRDYFINMFGFHAIYDIIATSGYEMAIRHNDDIRLFIFSYWLNLIVLAVLAYPVRIFFLQFLKTLWPITRMYSASALNWTICSRWLVATLTETINQK